MSEISNRALRRTLPRVTLPRRPSPESEAYASPSSNLLFAPAVQRSCAGLRATCHERSRHHSQHGASGATTFPAGHESSTRDHEHSGYECVACPDCARRSNASTKFAGISAGSFDRNIAQQRGGSSCGGARRDESSRDYGTACNWAGCSSGGWHEHHCCSSCNGRRPEPDNCPGDEHNCKYSTANARRGGASRCSGN